MGCGASLPKVEGFLVEQPTPANGYILGDLASTAAGNVTLHYSGGITNKGVAAGSYPTTNPVKIDGGDVIFTVLRAGDLNRPRDWIRGPTIAKDAAGRTIAMLKTDSTTKLKWDSVGNTYTGYCLAPRFDGQGAAFTADGVSMYSAFRVQNMDSKAGNLGYGKFNVYLIKDGAAFDSTPTYVLTTYFSCSATVKFLLTTYADNAGVAHGDTKFGGKITLTVVKGMDAGLALLAGFAPALLIAELEYVDSGPTGAAF